MTTNYASLKQRLPDGPWRVINVPGSGMLFEADDGTILINGFIRAGEFLQAIALIPSMLDDLTAPVPGEIGELIVKLRDRAESRSYATDSRLAPDTFYEWQAAAALQRLAQEIERLADDYNHLRETYDRLVKSHEVLQGDCAEAFDQNEKLTAELAMTHGLAQTYIQQRSNAKKERDAARSINTENT